MHQWFLCCTSVKECRVFKPLILWVVPELSSRSPSWLPVLAARQDRSTCVPCTLFCALQYFVLLGILHFEVFCAPCSISCSTLLYTVHQSTILCHLCCAPLLCTIFKPHYSAFVPRTALCRLCLASIQVLCRAPHTLFTNDAVNSWSCDEGVRLQMGDDGSTRQRGHAWWLHPPLVSDQLES